ncbi:hypothetical protein B0J17DRAFT_772730 [Rhizoctonia solani]|nr:hypothetical protein B0J17DRAFT_772730 [Rhizoctonia solani]
MGKLSPSVSGSGIFAAMFSTMTGLFFFLAPSPTHTDSDLGSLKTDVQQIVSSARRSQHRELMEFGEYVEKLISQLLSALENDQLARQAHIAKALQELHKTLHAISQRVLRIGKSGEWMSLTRHIRFPEEDPVRRMRRQLDDALKEFKFGALVDLLSNGSNPPAAAHATEASKPNLPAWTQTPSFPPFHDRSSAQGRSVSHTMHPVRHDASLSPYLDDHPGMQGAKPITSIGGSGPDSGEITIAFMNVERCRQSLRHTRSPTQVMKLAAALHHLSASLAKAGRTREALEASQESAGHYRSLAEKGV